MEYNLQDLPQISPVSSSATPPAVPSSDKLDGQRKLVEQELQQRDQTIRLQANLIELAHDAIIVRNPASRIVSWNKGAETLYGWAAHEILGQVTHTLLDTRFPQSREAVDNILERKGEWEGELIHTCRDGRQVIVESRQVLVRDEQGCPAATLEINRDITERWLRDAKVQALSETTRQMDEFLGIASHELRTPLTAIKGNLQLAKRQLNRMLKQDGITKEEVASTITAVQGLLDRAERQATIQNRLVNDLIDVSRIHAGHLELQIEPCGLTGIVREVVEDQRDINPTRTILFENPTMEVPVLADIDRVGQVVNNYLSNALKYSEETRPVEVRVELEGSIVRVSVRDEGPGLPPGEQERIWDRFYRAEGVEVKSGSGVGLGLGLHICRTIIEQLGGQVGVESKEGVGSTFWFTLPLVQSSGS
ncbi:MAG: PAS domain S-box protein [Chloroflexi bacterium]|nr:MAG: PAS domain S-box protein [Chloroflexota bacterium]